MTATCPRVPNRVLMLRESRGLLDMIRLPVTLGQPLRRRQNIGRGRRVIVLPGFGAGDRAMAPLRAYLRLHGFEAEGWGLGRNLAGLDKRHDPSEISWDLDLDRPYRGEAGVPYLCDLMAARVRERCHELGVTVSLVGWSLGGSIAREVARDLPDLVDHVVTLGSPVIGGPKYTRAAESFRQRGMDLDWIEAEVEKRNARPLTSPVSAIVSRSDGIVGFDAAHDLRQANTRYIVEDVSHLGMGYNVRTLRRVVEELVLRLETANPERVTGSQDRH